MGKQLTREEYYYICELHKDGVKQVDIAKAVGKSPSTICEIVKQGGRIKFKKNGGVIVCDKTQEYSPSLELDLSKLPDSVLFKHTNEFIF